MPSQRPVAAARNGSSSPPTCSPRGTSPTGWPRPAPTRAPPPCCPTTGSPRCCWTATTRPPDSRESVQAVRRHPGRSDGSAVVGADELLGGGGAVEVDGDPLVLRVEAELLGRALVARDVTDARAGVAERGADVVRGLGEDLLCGRGGRVGDRQVDRPHLGALRRLDLLRRTGLPRRR